MNRVSIAGSPGGIVSAEALWAALVDDTDRPIVIVTDDGEVVFANRQAADHVGLSDPSELLGRSFHDLCDHEYAEERLACIREVATLGGRMALDGMTRGRLRRTLMRSLGEDADGRSLVLLVHVPVPHEGEASAVPVRRAAVDDLGVLAELSEREMEVLKLIAKGYTTAQVAKALHRSVKTIEWHRVSLGSKLGVTNRVELARIAIRAGLVSAEETDERAETANGSGN